MQFKYLALSVLALLTSAVLAAPALETRQCVVFDGEICCSDGSGDTNCYPEKFKLKRSEGLEARQCIVFDGEVCCSDGDGDTTCS